MPVKFSLHFSFIYFLVHCVVKISTFLEILENCTFSTTQFLLLLHWLFSCNVSFFLHTKKSVQKKKNQDYNSSLNWRLTGQDCKSDLEKCSSRILVLLLFIVNLSTSAVYIAFLEVEDQNRSSPPLENDAFIYQGGLIALLLKTPGECREVSAAIIVLSSP